MLIKNIIITKIKKIMLKGFIGKALALAALLGIGGTQVKATSTHSKYIDPKATAGKSRGGKKYSLKKTFKRGWVTFATIKEGSRGGIKVGTTRRVFTVIGSKLS
jgi:hypothetical protein